MRQLFILCVVCFQYLYSSQVNLTQQEKEFIKNHPTITLGGGESFEPFLIQNNDGSISGYDVDIANLIKEKTGLAIKFKLGKWNKIQELAKQRKFDGISTAIMTPERKKYYIASKGYYSYVPLIIVNKGNPKKLYSIKDLKGKKVAIQKGNAGFIKHAQNIGDLEILSTIFIRIKCKVSIL